jgi:DNA-binding NarL/FixJ family response regulator
LLDGGWPLSSPIARKVVRHFHFVGPSPEESENLSPREQEVLRLLSAGYIYKEIADRLGIGIETVHTYVKKTARSCMFATGWRPWPNMAG